MSLIQVIFDNNLKQSDIMIPLFNSSPDEMGKDYTRNQTEVQQTSVYGIQSPLIKINNIVVDFSDVIQFSLSCKYRTPDINITVRDRDRLSEVLDSPSLDNELRVQILPKFDGVYKKINLTFYITSSNYYDGIIDIRGTYKSQKFHSTNIKSFGEINTYDLFKNIASELQLGFASNITSNDADKRFVYCANKNYIDLLDGEITRSGSDLQILDYWVDWWNNLVLADIYERYNAIDKDEDMQIWIAGQNKEMAEGNKIEPQQVVATLHNSPALMNNELYIQHKELINSPGIQLFFGSDKVYSVYESDKSEYLDYLIQDGDTQNDIFYNFEYIGETYSQYNYLLASRKRESFLQKINSNENIEITLTTPLLGLMRGNRVNILWYNNDSKLESIQEDMEELGLINNLESNIPLQDNKVENNAATGHFKLDKAVSGQYLITGCSIEFEDNNWSYVLKLSRPTSAKPKIITENNE